MIYICFQNNSLRHLSRGRLTAQYQDLLASPGPDGDLGVLGGREHEGYQDSLLLLAATGAVGKDTLRSSELPSLGTESQLLQLAQPSGPGKAQDHTQASNTGILELLLDELLAEIQVEENVPSPLDQDGGLGGREHDGAQDSLLPLAEAGCVGIDAWKLTDSLTFCRESQPPQCHSPLDQAKRRTPLKQATQILWSSSWINCQPKFKWRSRHKALWIWRTNGSKWTLT